MKTLNQPLSEQEMLVAPTIEQMQEVFETIAASTYRGVQGVLKIDSSSTDGGPTIGITTCTHGNEIAGLAPFVPYLKADRLAQLLRHGSVIVSVNNLEAARRFFAAKSEQERHQLRSLDCNMNRLPEDVLQRSGDTRYEIQRVLELASVFGEFDAALDIHSTIIPSKPMIVEIKGGLPLLAGAPIDTVLTNMVSVQRGIPVSALYGGNRQNVPVIGIEAGHQGQDRTLVDSTRIFQAFLQNINAIPGSPTMSTPKRDLYHLANSIFFPNASYRFVRAFRTFESIQCGETLAAGDGAPVLSPVDGHILFPKLKEFDFREDEAAFISNPVTS